MDAALDLLAERGEDRISLRELTGAAQANVAAVSYHFGSLKSLCDAAIEYALERYLTAQEESVGALNEDASIEELAAAFARPMMRALGGRGPRSGRHADRGAIRRIDPPEGWDRFNASFDRIRTGVLGVLRANVPDVKDQELIFRTRCAAGLLNWLVLAPGRGRASGIAPSARSSSCSSRFWAARSEASPQPDRPVKQVLDKF